MLAPSANQLSASIAGTAAGGAGAALAGAAALSTTLGPSAPPSTGKATAAAFSSSSSAAAAAAGLTCVSFMRHSIATHNEAAAGSADAMGSVYLSEAFADSSLSSRGHALVRRARQSMLGLSPAPSVVLCSPLTRAVQTAIAMFGGSGIPIVAVPEAREAYGRFPCDRHRDKSELELMFGDAVDFSLCPVQDTAWSPHHREEMSQLDRRVAGFVDDLLRREAGHVFVVSHGVFIEAALRQLAHGYPGHIGKNRVHNCDVHSFVFSVAPSSSAAAAAVACTSSCSGGGVGRVPPTAAASTAPPRVEAYLTGQGLALACAARMPLPAVAHVNRTIRRFSGDGQSLTERQFSALLARCEIGAQETRWLFCALDREGGGKVAAGDLLQALVAFHSGGEEAGGVAEPPGAHACHGLMDLRVRYQREMYGTPLANYELLDATFKRILFTVLAMS
ncbi:unnamed protein product [Ectocarpus sp. 12 AP-2014]